jgi:hypothetical protein
MVSLRSFIQSQTTLTSTFTVGEAISNPSSGGSGIGGPANGILEAEVNIVNMESSIGESILIGEIVDSVTADVTVHSLSALLEEDSSKW